MGSALPVRGDMSADDLRKFAKHCRHSRQARRALSIGAVLDGVSRGEVARLAAWIGKH